VASTEYNTEGALGFHAHTIVEPYSYPRSPPQVDTALTLVKEYQQNYEIIQGPFSQVVGHQDSYMYPTVIHDGDIQLVSSPIARSESNIGSVQAQPALNQPTTSHSVDLLGMGAQFY
jgi:hypothetical protein